MLFSPKTFLRELQEELQTALFNPQISFSVINDIYNKFINFFNGCDNIELEHIKVLADCCLQYIDCIQKHIDNTPIESKDHIESLKELISIVGSTSKLEGVKDAYLLCITVQIFEKVTEPDIKIWFSKELLQHFNVAIKGTRKHLRHSLVDKHPLYLCKFADLICTCGDYGYQILLLEVIFRLCSETQINQYARQLFPTSSAFRNGLCSITTVNFNKDVRTFLNLLNSQQKQVLSVKCDIVYLEKITVGAPKDLENNESPLWADFNFGTNTITILCDKDSLRGTSVASDNSTDDENFEIITVNREDVSNVRVSNLMVPDAAFSIGFIILFTMTDCSVLYPSSTEPGKDIELKLAISHCPELNILVKTLLPDWFGENVEYLSPLINKNLPQKKKTEYPSKGVYKPLQSDDFSSNPKIDVMIVNDSKKTSALVADVGHVKIQMNAVVASKKEYKPLPVENTPIRIKSTSELSTKSSVSDAQSLKNRIQAHHSKYFLPTEKRRITKSPKIHNIEQLKEIAADPQFSDLAQKQDNSRLLANLKREPKSIPDSSVNDDTEMSNTNTKPHLSFGKETDKFVVKWPWPNRVSVNKSSLSNLDEVENDSIPKEKDNKRKSTKKVTKNPKVFKKSQQKEIVITKLDQEVISNKIDSATNSAHLSTLNVLISGSICGSTENNTEEVLPGSSKSLHNEKTDDLETKTDQLVKESEATETHSTTNENHEEQMFEKSSDLEVFDLTLETVIESEQVVPIQKEHIVPPESEGKEGGSSDLIESSQVEEKKKGKLMVFAKKVKKQNITKRNQRKTKKAEDDKCAAQSNIETSIKDPIANQYEDHNKSCDVTTEKLQKDKSKSETGQKFTNMEDIQDYGCETEPNKQKYDPAVTETLFESLLEEYKARQKTSVGETNQKDVENSLLFSNEDKESESIQEQTLPEDFSNENDAIKESLTNKSIDKNVEINQKIFKTCFVNLELTNETQIQKALTKKANLKEIQNEELGESQGNSEVQVKVPSDKEDSFEGVLQKQKSSPEKKKQNEITSLNGKSSSELSLMGKQDREPKENKKSKKPLKEHLETNPLPNVVGSSKEYKRRNSAEAKNLKGKSRKPDELYSNIVEEETQESSSAEFVKELKIRNSQIISESKTRAKKDNSVEESKERSSEKLEKRRSKRKMKSALEPSQEKESSSIEEITNKNLKEAVEEECPNTNDLVQENPTSSQEFCENIIVGTKGKILKKPKRKVATRTKIPKRKGESKKQQKITDLQGFHDGKIQEIISSTETIPSIADNTKTNEEQALFSSTIEECPITKRKTLPLSDDSDNEEKRRPNKKISLPLEKSSKKTKEDQAQSAVATVKRKVPLDNGYEETPKRRRKLYTPNDTTHFDIPTIDLDAWESNSNLTETPNKNAQPRNTNVGKYTEPCIEPLNQNQVRGKNDSAQLETPTNKIKPTQNKEFKKPRASTSKRCQKLDNIEKLTEKKRPRKQQSTPWDSDFDLVLQSLKTTFEQYMDSEPKKRKSNTREIRESCKYKKLEQIKKKRNTTGPHYKKLTSQVSKTQQIRVRRQINSWVNISAEDVVKNKTQQHKVRREMNASVTITIEDDDDVENNPVDDSYRVSPLNTPVNSVQACVNNIDGWVEGASLFEEMQKLSRQMSNMEHVLLDIQNMLKGSKN